MRKIYTIMLVALLAVMLAACAQSTPTPQAIVETVVVEKEGETNYG